METSLQERARGCLVGLAVGDAVGTTVEFKPRGTFEPVTDMVGGGPFNLEAGQWTDDTSMALCLGQSLIDTKGFYIADQMEKYVQWYRHGYMSSNGRCFDIGTATSAAIQNYLTTGNALSGSTNPRSAGNGCLMRLAPVPIFYHKSLISCVDACMESSKTTHGAEECLAASALFGQILFRALRGDRKRAILEHYAFTYEGASKIEAIADMSYEHKLISEIRGTGYVVDSLEAALWCFWTTDSFEDAILKAVNLGDDADTTAAICGQVAGAYYGINGIPKHWLDRLCMVDKIINMADALAEIGSIDNEQQ